MTCHKLLVPVLTAGMIALDPETGQLLSDSSCDLCESGLNTCNIFSNSTQPHKHESGFLVVIILILRMYYVNFIVSTISCLQTICPTQDTASLDDKGMIPHY